MKQFSAVLALTLLFSCGRTDSNANQKEEREEFRPCGGVAEVMKFACIRPVNYILSTRLTNISKNIRINNVRVRDQEEYRYAVADSCVKPDSLKIVSNRTGSSIFFESMPMISSDAGIELIDLGDDCKGNIVIIKTTLADEDIRVDQSTRTINIDLD